MGNKSFGKILGVWDGVLTSVQQLLRKTYLYMGGPLLNQTFNNHLVYRIVVNTNTCYYSENQLFVQRSQYIRTENPLNKQSEKAKTCH